MNKVLISMYIHLSTTWSLDNLKDFKQIDVLLLLLTPSVGNRRPILWTQVGNIKCSCRRLKFVLQLQVLNEQLRENQWEFPWIQELCQLQHLLISMIQIIHVALRMISVTQMHLCFLNVNFFYWKPIFKIISIYFIPR